MKILGWDTETTDGYVRLLANSDGRTWVGHDHVEGYSAADTIALFDVLFSVGREADYNVFWNIKFDFAAILKPWVVRDAAALKANHLRAIRLRKEAALIQARQEVGEPLTVEERGRKHLALEEADAIESVEHFDLGVYRVLYIPKKGFRLTRSKRGRGRNSATFFDAMGWYSTGISEAAALDRAAKAHLGEGKSSEDEGLDVSRLGSDWTYFEAHREAVMRYCLKDCDLTRRLFEKTIAGFASLGVAFPREPWSRASVGREYLKRSKVLEGTRVAYELLMATGKRSMIEGAYRGACILTRGIGAWDDAWEYDLNSAYPAAMAPFPSLEGAYFVGPEDPRFEACFFKFYEIDLVPTPRMALPPRRSPKAHLLYHVGGTARRVFVTRYDLDAFDRWGDPYTVVRTVGIVTPSPERPLSFMADLYRFKDQIKTQYGKDSVEYQNIKIMLNGTYGILAQSRPREGRYTNFIYAAYITAWCRRELWAKAKDVEDDGGTILNLKTDGFIAVGAAHEPTSSRDLGAWEAEDVGTVTVFANGIYQVAGHLRKRGAPDLTPDMLRRSVVPYVTVEISGPLSLKQAIIQGKPELIGVWQTDRKVLTPWEMARDSGLRVPDELKHAPLKDYYTRSWILEHEEGPVATEPPRVAATVVTRS